MCDTKKRPEKKLELRPDSGGQRLDVYLAGARLGLTRNRAQRLIEEGLVEVADRIAKANYRLRPGDVVRLCIPGPEEVKSEPEDIPVVILYEDDSIVVADKPAGMVVHPAAGNYRGTLVNALLYRCGGLSPVGGDLRPGVVHRLDKDTSGVIVLAKKEPAHHALSRIFKRHEAQREYVAVATGSFREAEGTVAVPIGRHISERKKMSPITLKGRDAITHYRVLEDFGVASYIALRLKTGRTHQIRVHMAHIRHPLAGDVTYGGNAVRKVAGMKVGRQMLHARLLGFSHPATGEYMEFTSDPPNDMLRLIEYLRRISGR